MQAIHLSDTALEQLGITPGEVAAAIEAAIAEKRKGLLLVSPKSALMPGDGRYMMATLAVGPELIVVKQVSVCPGNKSRDLPDTNGAVMVLDSQSGLLKALMGANWITAVRTAALSDVAASRLADPQSAVMGFVGTGTQAQSHLAAFADRFPLRHAKIFGRGRPNIDALAAACDARGMTTEVVATGNEALDDADIVVTSLTLNYEIEPFLDAGRLKPGAFAAITDLAIPWRKDTMSALGTVIVDDLDQERAAAKPMVDAALISGDLANLVCDGVPATPAARAFVFRGIALGDYAAAGLALSRANAQNAGTAIGD